MSLELIVWIVLIVGFFITAFIILERNAPDAEKQEGLKVEENTNTEIRDVSENGVYYNEFQDYNIARTFANLLSVAGWIVLIVGIIFVFTGVSQVGNIAYGNSFLIKLTAMLPGLGIVMSGLLFIVVGQIFRATIVAANNTEEILKTMKNNEA